MTQISHMGWPPSFPSGSASLHLNMRLGARAWILRNAGAICWRKSPCLDCITAYICICAPNEPMGNNFRTRLIDSMSILASVSQVYQRPHKGKLPNWYTCYSILALLIHYLIIAKYIKEREPCFPKVLSMTNQRNHLSFEITQTQEHIFSYIRRALLRRKCLT